MSSKNTRNQAGGGGADWSTFPAAQDVDMDNYDFLNVGGINNSSQSQAGYVLTISTNKSLYWTTASGGTASAWSTFPATQNVDVNDKSLINVCNISSATLDVNGTTNLSGSVKINVITNNNYTPVANVLTLSSDNQTLFYRRPPMVTIGDTAPTTSNYGISGDLYIQRKSGTSYEFHVII